MQIDHTFKYISDSYKVLQLVAFSNVKLIACFVGMISLRIACVCTGNTCRSPIMEALLKRAIQQHQLPLSAESFGIAAADGAPASKRAINAASELGLDLSNHRSRSFGSIGSPADFHRFYVMSDAHANTLIECAIDPAKIRIVAQDDGGVPDPFGRDHAVYLATAGVLADAVEEITEEFQA